MTVRFVRPVSRAAYAGKWLAQASLLLLVLSGLGHRFGPLATPQFAALVLMAGAMAALSVPLAIIGLLSLWQVGARAGTASAKALVYAALPLGLLAYAGFLYETRPCLFDVTTDIIDPPAWKTPPVARQIWLPRPSAVSAADRQAQEKAYPGLTGRRYEGALDRVYQAVITVARANRMTLHTERPVPREKPAVPETPVVEALPAAPGAGTARKGAASGMPDVIPIPLPRPSFGIAVPLQGAGLDPAQGGDLILQGQTRTLILGFPFDVVIRLSEEAETTFVDMRVAVRYGPHDLGEGAEIAQSFLRALDAELLGIAAE
ncbi:DUF1499 domain-containing protein [Rhizobium sp. SGZ-381]|uniref:DUF1499 domain-containing protein n=1 Tax=Rhizobium sp. SGZ-381 TaxID=3342800 RepID=UPI00366EAFC5